MKNQKNRFEIPLYSFLLVFCAVFFYGTFQIRKGRAATLSDTFMPRLTIIILAVLLLVLLCQSIAKQWKFRGEKQSEEEKAVNRFCTLRFFYVLVIMAVSVWLMDKLGFVISMTIFLLLLFIGLAENGKPKWKIILPLSILFPLVMFIVYLKVFSILLPPGILNI